MLNFFQTHKRFKPISLTTFNLVLSVWLALALNMSFYQKLKQLTPYEGYHSLLFIVASVFIICALYNLVFQILHWRFNSKYLTAIWIIVGGLTAYFVNTLGVTITADQIQNMIQTDQKESFDLVTVHWFTWCGFFVLVPLLILYFSQIKVDTVKSTLIQKLINVFASLVVIGGLLFVYYVDYASIFRENRTLKGMVSPQNVISSGISYYKKLAPKKNLPLVTYGEDAHLIEQVDTSERPKLMVLVVGETARAESFSLNGYAKNTNPTLSKLDIINFNNVSSCGTATAVSVPCMFSGMPRKNYDESLASHREGLLDIAKRAGYKVTWIDNNSGCKGVCDRVESFKIPEPIQQKWCDSDGECHDEILLDSLKAYLSQLPKDDNSSHLIVLHQMGSHGPAYYKRTTPAFAPFKPSCDSKSIQGCSKEELLNSYDNSIVYTDHVLSSMINSLEKITDYQTGFWYLSDHGESTGEHGMYLHGSPYAIAPTQQTHIPMLMWFSKQWQHNHQGSVDCLNQQKGASLSQDNLFPTLLSLLDIKTQTIDERLDLLKQCNVNLPKRA